MTEDSRSSETSAVRMVQQHDLVYEIPPRVWEDGFPIGNGHLGAMVWQPEGPDRIELGITKLDVWDRRTQQAELLAFDRFKELLAADPESARRALASEPAYDAPYPCPKLCGNVSIGLDEAFLPLAGSLYDQIQRLSLSDATVTVEYEVSFKRVRIEAFVHAETNVLCLRVGNSWVHETLCPATKQRITISRETDESLGPPETGTRDRAIYVRYRFPDGFEYVLAATVRGAPASFPVVLPNSVALDVDLEKPTLGKAYHLYVTVATSLESQHPLDLALEQLATAAERGWDVTYESHRYWWRGFWSNSAVELSDRFLEGLWYYSIYQLASTSRGETAPGLFGLWNMTATPPWHGDYHGDYNLSMAHWYLFSSNHLELGRPYFRTVGAMLEAVKAHTREVYQIDGAKFPIATAPGTTVEMARHAYRLMQVSSAYYCIPLWWHYLYSRDVNFLTEVALPILEECSKFYLALVSETPDGPVIGPSWAPEQGPLPAHNVTNDLALIKVVWTGYVEGCTVTGRRSRWLEPVRDSLARFPAYPRSETRFLDSLEAPDDLMLAHPGLISMVYPAGEVDADHPLASLAAATVDTYQERTQRRSYAGRSSGSDVQGWVMQALCSARLRLAETLDRYLMDVGISEYLKPNGMITILSNAVFASRDSKRAAYDFGNEARAHHVIYLTSSTRTGRDRHIQFLEGPSALVCIMNEMLLQSHQGILRVFPALPERLAACAFRDLRAQGAFLVSARCRDTVERVEITSLAGEQCTLQLFRYREDTPVRFRGPSGPVEPTRLGPSTWSFATERGRRYTVDAGTQECRPVDLVPADTPAGPKWIVDCHGVRVYYGKPRSWHPWQDAET